MRTRTKCLLIGAALFSFAFVRGIAAEAVTPITPTNRVDLFNGTDLSGWTWFAKNQDEAAKTWSVADGVIHCAGKPTGYLRTDTDYRDYKLRVEFRFIKAGNSGVLVHMQA